jgi:hypothetical protein
MVQVRRLREDWMCWEVVGNWILSSLVRHDCCFLNAHTDFLSLNTKRAWLGTNMILQYRDTQVSLICKYLPFVESLLHHLSVFLHSTLWWVLRNASQVIIQLWWTPNSLFLDMSIMRYKLRWLVAATAEPISVLKLLLYLLSPLISHLFDLTGVHRRITPNIRLLNLVWHLYRSVFLFWILILRLFLARIKLMHHQFISAAILISLEHARWAFVMLVDHILFVLLSRTAEDLRANYFGGQEVMPRGGVRLIDGLRLTWWGT